MAATTTVHVPHLGGITVGYRLSSPFDAAKPTMVLINSMCTTVSLFRTQFDDPKIAEAMNLLAIEPLGHGATAADNPDCHFNYWDTATMALQAMTALNVDKAFALGTSQGGWIVVRMALLAPDRVLGLLPLGTSMDCESAESRDEGGCWDPKTMLTPFYEKWSVATAEGAGQFVVDDVWCGMVAGIGFGDAATEEMVEFWKKTVADVYSGESARKKLRMALVTLIERDGLLMRVQDVKCPVHWLQGSKDVPYGTKVQSGHLALFTSCVDKKLTIVEGGHHYLNGTNPKEIGEAMLEMVAKK